MEMSSLETRDDKYLTEGLTTTGSIHSISFQQRLRNEDFKGGSDMKTLQYSAHRKKQPRWGNLFEIMSNN